METNKLTIFCDGGARGNPGPAAIGVVIASKKYNDYLGRATNNEAEYEAVIFALKKAKQLLGKSKAKKTNLEINVDSELIYKQVLGEYKINEHHLQKLFIQVWNLKQDFNEVDLKLVPREQNREADFLVNDALDNPRKSTPRLF